MSAGVGIRGQRKSFVVWNNPLHGFLDLGAELSRGRTGFIGVIVIVPPGWTSTFTSSPGLRWESWSSVESKMIPCELPILVRVLIMVLQCFTDAALSNPETGGSLATKGPQPAAPFRWRTSGGSRKSPGKDFVRLRGPHSNLPPFTLVSPEQYLQYREQRSSLLCNRILFGIEFVTLTLLDFQLFHKFIKIKSISKPSTLNFMYEFTTWSNLDRLNNNSITDDKRLSKFFEYLSSRDKKRIIGSG